MPLINFETSFPLTLSQNCVLVSSKDLNQASTFAIIDKNFINSR